MNFLTYKPIIEGIDLQIKSRGKIGNEACNLDLSAYRAVNIKSKTQQEAICSQYKNMDIRII